MVDKIDERLLTDEALSSIICSSANGDQCINKGVMNIDREIAQAQLAKDEARHQQEKEEFVRNIGEIIYDVTSSDPDQSVVSKWQSLIAEYLRKTERFEQVVSHPDWDKNVENEG